MANQTCISIGIDRYQFLPQLGYGQADAVAIEQFFIDAAGWSPSQCLLLTDTSPKHGDKFTYPDRLNLNYWLENWSWEHLRAGDLVWFFFSGCGVNCGDEDYLIPIDGNPDDLVNTCISIRDIYKQLHDIGVNAFVFLDANRSQTQSIGDGIGKVTAQLAQRYQIPTFLSCQSHEVSHEDSNLGHGLFTTALLETLNYHPDLNLETIDTYLGSRLRELSEHHWKPPQTPMAIVPTGVSVHRPVFSATTIETIAATIPEVVYTPPTRPNINPDDRYAAYTPPSVLIISPDSIGTGAIVNRKKPKPIAKKLPPWAKISFLLSLVVGAGCAIYALTIPSPPNQEQPATTKPIGDKLTNSLPPNLPRAVGETTSIAQAKLFVKDGDATSHYIAIEAARRIPPNAATATEVKQSIELWSQEIDRIAQRYAKQKKWQIAIRTAEMVPPDASNYSTVRAAIVQWQKNLN